MLVSDRLVKIMLIKIGQPKRKYDHLHQIMTTGELFTTFFYMINTLMQFILNLLITCHGGAMVSYVAAVLDVLSSIPESQQIFV